MAVRLVFLGKLADLAGAPEREFPAPLDWPALLVALPGALGEAARGDKVKLAVNGAIVADEGVTLPGGSRVIVVADRGAGAFVATAEEERALLEAIAGVERGETVRAADLLERLRR